MQPSNILLTTLIAEVQELTGTVRELVKTTPQRSKTWLEPRELTMLLGISTRTLQNWRAAGRFRPESVRLGHRGYQFHAELALQDAQRIGRSRDQPI